jgi:predicted DNA-binding transcriptional regulator AlpA
VNERREPLLSPREVQAVLGLSRSGTYLAIREMTHVRKGRET